MDVSLRWSTPSPPRAGAGGGRQDRGTARRTDRSSRRPRAGSELLARFGRGAAGAARASRSFSDGRLFRLDGARGSAASSSSSRVATVSTMRRTHASTCAVS